MNALAAAIGALLLAALSIAVLYALASMPLRILIASILHFARTAGIVMLGAFGISSLIDRLAHFFR